MMIIIMRRKGTGKVETEAKGKGGEEKKYIGRQILINRHIDRQFARQIGRQADTEAELASQHSKAISLSEKGIEI